MVEAETEPTSDVQEKNAFKCYEGTIYTERDRSRQIHKIN